MIYSELVELFNAIFIFISPFLSRINVFGGNKKFQTFDVSMLSWRLYISQRAEVYFIFFLASPTNWLLPVSATFLPVLPLNDSNNRVRYTKIPTQVKVHGPVRPRNGPVFRSLNISTFQGLKTCNGPIIFIIYTGPL